MSKLECRACGFVAKSIDEIASFSRGFCKDCYRLRKYWELQKRKNPSQIRKTISPSFSIVGAYCDIYKYFKAQSGKIKKVCSECGKPLTPYNASKFSLYFRGVTPKTTLLCDKCFIKKHENAPEGKQIQRLFPQLLTKEQVTIYNLLSNPKSLFFRGNHKHYK